MDFLKKLLFPAILLFVIYNSCSDDPTSPAEPTEPITISTIEQTVGNDGGTITNEDSTLVIQIPENSLPSDTEIKVHEQEGVELLDLAAGSQSGNSYKLEPEGLQFSEPIKVTVSIDSFWSSFNPEKSSLLHWSDVNNFMEVIMASVNEQDNTVTFLIDSFSYLTPFETEGLDNGIRVFNWNWKARNLNMYFDISDHELYDTDLIKHLSYQWSYSGGISYTTAGEEQLAQVLIRDVENTDELTCNVSGIKFDYGMVCLDSIELDNNDQMHTTEPVEILLNTNKILTNTGADVQTTMASAVLRGLGHAIGIAQPSRDDSECSNMIMANGTYAQELHACDIEAIQYKYGNNNDLTGKWKGLYEWHCADTGESEVQFTIEESNSGFISGSVSYLGAQNDITGIRIGEPEYWDTYYFDGSRDVFGDYFRISVNEVEGYFVYNRFYGEISSDFNSVSGTTLNGDSPFLDGDGCSLREEHGPTGEFYIERIDPLELL